MRLLTALLCLLFSLHSYSQEPSVYFYNHKGESIDKQTFFDSLKVPKHKYAYKLIENDTAVLGSLFLREEINIITQEERKSLIKELELLSGQKIKDSQTIVIDFFSLPSKDDTSYNGFFNKYTKNRSYLRFFKKNDGYVHFFVSQKDYIQDGFIEDKNNYLLKNLFSNYEASYGNYIIIKPNGHYLRRLDEHRQDEIIYKIKGDW